MAKVKASVEDMLHVTKWHNGDKRWSPFSDAEMTRRQNDIRAHVLSQYLLLLRFPLLLFWPQVRPSNRPEQGDHGYGSHRRRPALAAHIWR
jgi:hypothetical protein